MSERIYGNVCVSVCEEPLKTVLRATCSSQSCTLLLSFLNDPPPVHGGWLISTLYRVCLCMCVFLVLGESASPLRSTESEAAGAADADRLFSRQGQLGGHRKGENEWETIEQKATGTQTNTRSDLWTAPDKWIYQPECSLSTVCENEGNRTWTEPEAPDFALASVVYVSNDFKYI